LAACAATPPAPPAATTGPLFTDARFEPPSRPVDAADVFAATPEMQAYVEHEIHPRVRQIGPKQALVEALFRKGQLKLEYDSSRTRNAREAFAAREGNCLSLVIMTAALAKQMGLPVTYQSVRTEQLWSRRGDLYVASGHVNITIGRPANELFTSYDSEAYLTVDFLPPEDLHGLRTRPIDEHTVIAMYMNNRAAETLAAGRTTDAYWFAREAIVQSPSFVPAYNTLGVIYLQHGQPEDAERVLALALRQRPDDRQLLSNEAIALRALGRQAEAEAMSRQLAALEPYPPFHFFELGLNALQRGDNATARDLFQKELDRAPYYHEFHFWLGVAQLRLGQESEARKHFELAIENSTTRGERALYAAKLDHLKSSSVH
jgi:Tfp pilus assembly protein PilF